MGIIPQEPYSSLENNESLGSRNWAYLMCPPDHFGIAYEINPWMDRTNQPDPDRAREQWYRLVACLKEAGARVEFLPPVPSLPDKVFTADIGLIDRNRFVMSRFRYAQRQPETYQGADWFRSRDYEVVELPLEAEESLECSDVCLFGGVLLAGYGFRTTLSAHGTIARLLRKRVLSIEFIDSRFYHLDTSFCPLDDRRALITPAAWSRRGCQLIERLVPEPLVLELDEAMTFCANSLVVGKTVIMPSCPPRVGHLLERWGFTICVTPLSEFLKAGGGVHCLTLDLQGQFSQTSDLTSQYTARTPNVPPAHHRSP
jgi:N-dimethylarginine dimethylaminohydrolase